MTDKTETETPAPGKRASYASELNALQCELVETQAWLIEQGKKVVIVLEGRDGAGKDGVIKRISEHLNSRHTTVVALPKPGEREQSQWYFQRYVPYLPAAGELTIFNRSWYNRAGVEPVMGFCTEQQHQQFLRDTRRFEHMLTDGGIYLIKLWLDITKDEQQVRLAERVHDPLKRFKLSYIDSEAQNRWDDYTKARDLMFKETHSKYSPWTIVATDSKRSARINTIREILRRLNRPGSTAAQPNPKVVFTADHAEGRLAQ